MNTILNSWTAMANRIPPKICLMLARRNRRGMTTDEVVKASGLSRQMICHLKGREDFSGVPIDVVDRFQKACGITPRNMAYQLRYMKRTFGVSARPLHHLEGAMSAEMKRGISKSKNLA